MAKQRLLVVDSDARSLRVLEVSLRKAGYNVTTAVDGADALEKVQTEPPDLIISDTALSSMDGYAFAKEVKSNPEWATIPFIFLSRSATIEEKVKGLELGVDDFLTKPIFVKEIVTRVRILLQRMARESLERRTGTRIAFAGSLEDMTAVDLLQTIDFSRKSGVLQLTQESDAGRVYFREGCVIDAELGSLKAEDAIYRFLTWSQGTFEFDFRDVRREARIEDPTPSLLMEGMRRVDEWGRLLEGLPHLESSFEVDYHELAEQLADIPDEVNQILRLFDGNRTIMAVVDQAGMGDLEALGTISKLYFDGLVYDPSAENAAPFEAEEHPPFATAAPSTEPVGPAHSETAEVPQDPRLEDSAPPKLATDDLEDVEASPPPAIATDELEETEEKTTTASQLPAKRHSTEPSLVAPPPAKPEVSEPQDDKQRYVPPEPGEANQERATNRTSQERAEVATSPILKVASEHPPSPAATETTEEAPPEEASPETSEEPDAARPARVSTLTGLAAVSDDQLDEKAQEASEAPAKEAIEEPDEKPPEPETTPLEPTAEGDADAAEKTAVESEPQAPRAHEDEKPPKESALEPTEEEAVEPPAEPALKPLPAVKEPESEPASADSTAPEEKDAPKTPRQETLIDHSLSAEVGDSLEDAEAEYTRPRKPTLQGIPPSPSEQEAEKKVSAGEASDTAAPAKEKDEEPEVPKEKKEKKTAEEKEPKAPPSSKEKEGEPVKQDDSWQRAFFKAGEAPQVQEYDSFTDLDTIGEEPVSKLPMFLAIALIAAIVIGGGVFLYIQQTDTSRIYSDDNIGQILAEAGDDDEQGSSSDTSTTAPVDEPSEAVPVDPGAVPGAVDAAIAELDSGGAVGEPLETSTVDAGEEPPPADDASSVVPEPTGEPTPEQRREAGHLANRAAMTVGNPDHALELAQQAITLDPNQAMGWYVVGYIENQRGNTDVARQALERCIAGRGSGQSDCRSLLRRLSE